MGKEKVQIEKYASREEAKTAGARRYAMKLYGKVKRDRAKFTIEGR